MNLSTGHRPEGPESRGGGDYSLQRSQTASWIDIWQKVCGRDLRKTEIPIRLLNKSLRRRRLKIFMGL